MTIRKWYSKVIGATASYIMRIVKDETPFEEREATVVHNLLRLLGEFTWPSHFGADLDIGARAEVIGQASEILALAGTFLHPAADIPFSEFERLQSFFKNFRMHPEWAKLCSEASAGEVDFAASFSDTVAQRLYSSDIQRRAFEFTVSAAGMRAELAAFKACIPMEHRSLQTRLEFGVLDTRGLVSIASVVGDVKLVSQLQFLCAFHELLKSAAALAACRSITKDSGDHAKATCGRPGGTTVVDETSVAQLNSVRECLTPARAVQGAHGMETAFQAVKDSPRHLSDLDQFLDPSAFGPFAMELVEVELEVWRSSWEEQLPASVPTVRSGLVHGWELRKDSLLDEEAADIRKALLTNAKFTQVSAEVSTLAVALKKLDSPFLSAATMGDVAQMVRDGVELVSTTYAMYLLLRVIPTKRNRAAEVKKLRDEMKFRRVLLGASLEAEACRLESAKQARAARSARATPFGEVIGALGLHQIS